MDGAFGLSRHSISLSSVALVLATTSALACYLGAIWTGSIYLGFRAAKLTKRIVSNASASRSRWSCCWVAEVTRFGCKITPAGRRRYFCDYRNQGWRPATPRVASTAT